MVSSSPEPSAHAATATGAPHRQTRHGHVHCCRGTPHTIVPVPGMGMHREPYLRGQRPRVGGVAAPGVPHRSC
jgi:hypothetical protein